MKVFDPKELKKLYRPASDSSGEQNGQVTIIGGSSLFHGAPFLSIKAASRIVDMVFFGSPEPSVGEVASKIKSKLFSFIWVPWDEIDKYIEKSDAVLVGPGMMRYKTVNRISAISSQSVSVQINRRTDNRKLKPDKPKFDSEGKLTRDITKKLLLKFSHKKWVIDAGSLQTMEKSWIPKNAIVTPNKKEFQILFGDSKYLVASSKERNKTENQTTEYILHATKMARKFNCTIVLKGPETLVTNGKDTVLVKGGNAGLTKGGTGDVLAGLTVGLLAKNDPFLAACAASYIEKAAADELYKKVGTAYNADDLGDEIPLTLHKR